MAPDRGCRRPPAWPLPMRVCCSSGRRRGWRRADAHRPQVLRGHADRGPTSKPRWLAYWRSGLRPTPRRDERGPPSFIFALNRSRPVASTPSSGPSRSARCPWRRRTSGPSSSRSSRCSPSACCCSAPGSARPCGRSPTTPTWPRRRASTSTASILSCGSWARRWPRLGGVLSASPSRCSFEMGFELLLLMFAGITLGGLGTAYGALVGSFIVGLFVQRVDAVDPARPQERRRPGRPHRHPAGPAAGHPRPGRAGRAERDGLGPHLRERRSRRVVGRGRALRPGRHRAQHPLRLHRPAQLRPGRLPGRRRLRPRHQRSTYFGWSFWVGVLVGLLAAVVLALLLGCPPCGCGPTTWPSSPSPPARSSAWSLRSTCVPTVHRRRRTGCRTSPTTSTTSTRSAPATLRLLGRSSSTSARLWLLLVGWALVALLRLLVFLLDAQPVGPGAQGDPRGRGRRPQPRQERLLLQDAEPGPRRRLRRARRLRLRPRHAVGAARQLLHRRSRSSPTPR